MISTELSPLYRKVGKKNYIREALFADAVTDVAKRALRLSGDKLKELGATAQDILDVCRWQVKKDRGNFMQALRAGRSPQTIWEGVVAEDELTSYDWDKALRRVLDDTHTPAKTNPVAATHSAAAAANSCDKAVEVVIADLFGLHLQKTNTSLAARTVKSKSTSDAMRGKKTMSTCQGHSPSQSQDQRGLRRQHTARSVGQTSKRNLKSLP